MIEIRAELVAVGRRSRRLQFRLLVLTRGAARADQPGAADVLPEPLVATTAVGTVVVP